MSNVDIPARIRELEATIDGFRREMADVRTMDASNRDLAAKLRSAGNVQAVAFEARELARKFEKALNAPEQSDQSINSLNSRICNIHLRLEKLEDHCLSSNPERLIDRVAQLEVNCATSDDLELEIDGLRSQLTEPKQGHSNYSLQDDLDEAMDEIERLKAKNKSLREEIRRLQAAR